MFYILDFISESNLRFMIKNAIKVKDNLQEIIIERYNASILI